MDRMVKTDVDKRDKAYFARCINELKKWGAPCGRSTSNSNL